MDIPECEQNHASIQAITTTKLQAKERHSKNGSTEQSQVSLQMREKQVGASSKVELIPSETGWAWMVLIGAFLCRVLTDGLLTSLGVFIVAWKEHFQGSMTQLTWISSLLAGITYLVGPLGSALLKRFSIRQVVMTGAILTSSAFIAASFATQLWHLYVTSTIAGKYHGGGMTGAVLTSAAFIAASFATQLWHLYVTSTIAGLGLGLSYQPSFVILTYYFDTKLARVSGIASLGSACGMLFLPPLFHIIISYYSWEDAILILAGCVANIGVCAALYRPNALEIKTRLHNPKSGGTAANGVIQNVFSSIIDHGDFMLFKNIYFIFLMIAYFLYGLSFIIAFHYISVRAVHSGTSEQNAAYLLSSIGIGSCVSRLAQGFIIDHHLLTATVLTSISYLVCGFSCIMTPISDEFILLAVWAVLIGLASGVYHVTIPNVAKEFVQLEHLSGAMGWMLLMSGGGVILGSYLTGVLVDATGNYDFPFYLAGVCFVFCAVFMSAKLMTSNIKHMDGMMIPTVSTQDTYLKGVINKASQTEDIEHVDHKRTRMIRTVSNTTQDTYLQGVINKASQTEDTEDVDHRRTRTTDFYHRSPQQIDVDHKKTMASDFYHRSPEQINSISSSCVRNLYDGNICII